MQISATEGFRGQAFKEIEDRRVGRKGTASQRNRLCYIATEEPIDFDPYEENRETGGFILVGRHTSATLGAGMIRSSDAELTVDALNNSAEELADRIIHFMQQRGMWTLAMQKQVPTAFPMLAE